MILPMLYILQVRQVDVKGGIYKLLYERKYISSYDLKIALRKRMSIFGVILVRIFSHSDSIRRDTEYHSVFSLNAGKYGPE